jgi:formate hydrogenlyase subunit 4
MMRSIFAIVAVGAMLLSSVAASAQSTRTASPIDDQEQIAGNPWVPWAVGLIAALIILFVVLDDEGDPQSP